MTKEKQKFYITTAIPFVNAKPHLGFALEIVQADVLARARRAKGEDVYFVAGTDENALKNVISAEEKGVEVNTIIAENAEAFRALKHTLNLSWDDFMRTTEERHVRGAQKFWLACRSEDIYKKKYKGFYCVGCEEFKTQKDLVNDRCPEHPTKSLEVVEEENYFFRLSAYQDKLKDLIVSGKLQIVPEARKNEVLAFINRGLEDFSISRSEKRARGWGIPVPEDPSQIMYVWFDALTNYINVLGYADKSERFEVYWEQNDAILHCIGKGISRFHAIYWPAMLFSVGERLPHTILVHGYITIDGKKISKSLGNVMSPEEVTKHYGIDAVRYYLLREIPAFDDGDFSYARFDERYTADLANGLGNFVARVVALAAPFGEIKSERTHDSLVEDRIQIASREAERKLGEFKFHEALAAIWELIGFGDAYVNEKKPWSIKDDVEKKKVLVKLLEIVEALSQLLVPFLPETADKIKTSVQRQGDIVAIKKGEILFPRLS